MGPRAGLDGRKISSPPGFDPRSQSLYRLSYPAHIMLCNRIWIYTRKHTQNKNGYLTVGCKIKHKKGFTVVSYDCDILATTVIFWQLPAEEYRLGGI